MERRLQAVCYGVLGSGAAAAALCRGAAVPPLDRAAHLARMLISAGFVRAGGNVSCLLCVVDCDSCRSLLIECRPKSHACSTEQTASRTAHCSELQCMHFEQYAISMMLLSTLTVAQSQNPNE